MGAIAIREAELSDATHVASIYNQGIADRCATFETEPRSAMCQACGFREVGIYEKHGRLDGNWLDVVIVERLIVENPSESVQPDGQTATSTTCD